MESFELDCAYSVHFSGDLVEVAIRILRPHVPWLQIYENILRRWEVTGTLLESYTGQLDQIPTNSGRSDALQQRTPPYLIWHLVICHWLPFIRLLYMNMCNYFLICVIRCMYFSSLWYIIHMLSCNIYMFSRIIYRLCYGQAIYNFYLSYLIFVNFFVFSSLHRIHTFSHVSLFHT